MAELNIGMPEYKNYLGWRLVYENGPYSLCWHCI